MRKIIILLLALGLVAAVFSQPVPTLLIPIWTGTHYTWLRLGTSFTTAGGALEVVFSSPKARVYGARLTWEATASGYRLPSGAQAVVVYVNGFRYSTPEDYTITAGVVVPVADNWPPPASAIVVADYDP